VDRDIAWAKKNGLSIILDMHQWIWSPHFTYPGKGTNGVPSWSVRGYPDSAYGKNQSVADFWLGKGLNGTIASLTNPSMKDRYVEAWKHVALRYANEPTIMAYDLFNEPPDATAEWLTTPQVSDALFSLYAKLIDAIRDVDSKHILIYQALGGGAWWARLIDLPNMAFSTHFYDLDRTYDGNKSKIENDFLARRWNAPVEDPINSWNIPILIGEFGYNDNWENSELWVRDVLSIFDKYQIKTQLWWAYFKSDTFGKALLLRNGTERIQVKYLDRPYPRVTSFVPLHWSFNCDKEEFAIEVANGTHWLQIYIPSRYYASFTFHTNATVLSMFWNKEFGILIIQFVVEKPTEVIIQMLPESC
jgi:endoglycosylceramidase